MHTVYAHWRLLRRYALTSAMLPLGGILFALLLYSVFSGRPDNVCSGVLVTNSLLNGFILVPVAGVAVGCWIAIREFRSDLRSARAVAVSTGRLDGSVEVLFAIGWVLFFAELAYMVAVIWTDNLECQGGVNAVAVFSTALGSAVSVVVGYWIGYAFPHVMLLPLLVVLSFVLVSTVTNSYGQFFTLWFPVTGATMSVFYDWRPGVFWSQLPWFAGLILVSVLVRGLIASRSRKLAAALFASILVAVGGNVAISHYDGRWENTGVAPSFVPFCSGSSPRVCVSPSFELVVPAVSEVYGPFMEKVTGTQLFTSTLEQRPRSVHGQATLPDAKAFHLDGGDAVSVQGSLAEYIETSVNLDSCYRPVGQDGIPQIVRAGPYTAVVVDWLLGGSGRPQGADQRARDWFDTLSTSAKTAWFGAHADKFLDCALEESDFS